MTAFSCLASLAIALLAMAALMTPLLRYVLVGWRAKRQDIMDGLNAEARLAYYRMFCRTESVTSADVAMTEFEKLYQTWYGRKYFILPGVIFVLVGTIEITLVSFSTLHDLQFISSNPLFDVPVTAVAAIAGAYLWVADDFISRARRLDFSPSDVQWGTLRLVIAVPMGYAFATVASKDLGPFVAFALGAFPLTALISMLQRLARKGVGIEATKEEGTDDIIKLQGIYPTIVDRLSFEDISTVTQVAYCDPVRLVMRSNLTFNFVTDCMNQALAWMYFQDQLGTVLRPMGMRGAVEIKCLIDEFDDTSSTDADSKAAHELALVALPQMADKLGSSPEALQIAFRQIAEDPFTAFLCEVWS